MCEQVMSMCLDGSTVYTCTRELDFIQRNSEAAEPLQH